MYFVDHLETAVIAYGRDFFVCVSLVLSLTKIVNGQILQFGVKIRRNETSGLGHENQESPV